MAFWGKAEYFENCRPVPNGLLYSAKFSTGGSISQAFGDHKGFKLLEESHAVMKQLLEASYKEEEGKVDGTKCV